MNEKRCKNCNAILDEGEKYCLFCGEKQTETQEKTEPINHQEKKDYTSIWASIGAFIILIIGGSIGSKILAGVGIFLVAYLVRSKFDNKDKQKSSKNNKVILILIGIVFFLIFILGFNYSNTNTSQVNEEAYTFEIEPEYRQVIPATIEVFTERLEEQLQEISVDYQNIAMEEEYRLFTIQMDIVNINDKDEAIEVFKQIIHRLSRESEEYVYIKDLIIYFYVNDEYQYAIRLFNPFMINVLDLEKDSIFYDVKSNLSVQLKTAEDESFTFPTDTNETLTLSEEGEKYLSDFNNWYDGFDVYSNEVYAEFVKFGNLLIDDGVSTTQKELKELETLSQTFSKRCNQLNQIETSTYYEVFHQYSSRGCQYFASGFKKSLDGLEYSSVDRINYAYLDYIIGNEYFELATDVNID